MHGLNIKVNKPDDELLLQIKELPKEGILLKAIYTSGNMYRISLDDLGQKKIRTICCFLE